MVSRVESTIETLQLLQRLRSDPCMPAFLRELSKRGAVAPAGEPCSFCHATGFTGTNVCQECRGAGTAGADRFFYNRLWHLLAPETGK